MQPVCKKVVVHDKIEEIGLKSKLTLRPGGGGGRNLSVNLTLSVQWVGMDSFPWLTIMLVVTRTKFINLLLHKVAKN